MMTRYGEYEQEYGSVASRLMDEVESLRETIINLEGEIERLTKIQRAAIEVVDGVSWWELQEQTGINEDRCKEILSIIRGEA